MPPSETPRGGRPRNPEIDAAVLDATLALLDEVGYNHLSIEEVGRRAGTTKPAVYRRWPNRQRLVLAALTRQLGELPVPDTGCTLCDLGEGVLVYVTAFQRMPPDVLGPLLADCAADADLRAAFMSTLFLPPRAAVRTLLERARERGDLRADLDLELTLDLLGSLVHYRALFGHAQVTEAEVEQAIETVLRGAATDYPALVEHSLALEAAHHLHG
ncbi:TetR/AcrR family transcriptional regulator [Actinophytocola gossypii]|uniref:TetR/AcrR family transcriptional regulator n=1 Tax=Actinophytocola gossypii TaxID=2812003 RepID=A0ABT2J7Z9_9PSEU|nr:TetR/AcrR family transcriptional regulator [Actinophytocola gossypii]MCT2583615.1 TetR/AcrR family transcriptional regulator [Actinophytocola gossypii]